MESAIGVGCLPSLYPPMCFRKEDREPARRPAGPGGVVGQETGTWGEGAGEGRTGAGGTERSTPSDWQRKAMATCLVTFRPRIPHRAPSRKSQKLRATHATRPSKPANDI